MPKTINIVEPTLTNESGHCFSFINSLCLNIKEVNIILWGNRNSSLIFPQKNIVQKKIFFRKIRKIQCFFLYKKLLKTPGKILISTAGVIDLLFLNWMAKGRIRPNKAYLYFHWIKQENKKLKQLRRLAIKQPNVIILGPTLSVVKIFQDAGFKHTHIAPYPISPKALPDKNSHSFIRVLYAGAARQDKGFSKVVDLLEYAHRLQLQIPFMLQTSADHYGKYDQETKSDIVRLKNIPYPHLEMCENTLTQKAYSEFFVGAICIQPYLPIDFADRISGITLDALSAGSPIVTTAGTWMARQVIRFDAGIVVETTTPDVMLVAIERIIANYNYFSKNSITAGRTLQDEHSAHHLANIILNN